MISIIDYGIGNVPSVLKALTRQSIQASIVARPADLLQASRIILPGVGHFAAGMRKLKDSGFAEVLEQKVRGEGIPILGICLGMQFFTSWSEEGDVAGLGWIPGQTRRFSFSDTVHKVPHIGWNTAEKACEYSIFNGIDPLDQFYFVHSYFVECDDQADVVAKTTYGTTFDSSIRKGNIFGVQFHPEKSQMAGLKLLKNFCEGCV